MRVLVVTVVHRPDDARIRQRQIPALLAAGHDVVYAAPFAGWGLTLPHPAGGLTCLDLPRARGRRRLAANVAAGRLLRERAGSVDVVLVHDPELVPVATTLRGPAVVWDVHEDTAEALSMKSWLPTRLRRPVARAVTTLERLAERRLHLLLAEEGYRVRFTRQHPVVPNSTPVPERVPTPDRPVAVYVGHVTRARGVDALVGVGRRLAEAGSAVRVEVIGHADAEATRLLQDAQRRGWLTWHGFLPNRVALELVEGATAGLSLLRDEPNYRHSRPTKVLEYMARGVPVVTTPNPPSLALVKTHHSGVVVPFDDSEAAAQAVLALHADPVRRHSLGAAGHSAALRHHDWNTDGARFVARLATWAQDTP